MSMSVWTVTCRLLSKHLSSGGRIDALLETLPVQMPAEERRRCRHLLYGAVRHRGLLEWAIRAHVPRAPRPGLLAVLLLGAFELMEHPQEAPSIVHHWVGCARETTSAGESRLVNAVLRRLPATLEAAAADTSTDPATLARNFSHPAWLVERWLGRYGTDATRQLLHWNQQPAPVHARVARMPPTGHALGALPSFFEPTPWDGFHRLDRPDWTVVEQWLAEGRIYIQDPATALAPGLLAVKPGEAVLDLCAAPGGKTLQLAEAAVPGGHVLAVDLPGARLERLRRNVGSRPDLPVTVLGHDATRLESSGLRALGLPEAFDAVLVDVPCSNTGVLRHRVDVKERLQPADIDGLVRLQKAMLARAAELARPGGRIVYSTCSLEPEENVELVSGFIDETRGGFAMIEARRSLPWESGCDGAGAFLIERTA